LISLLADERVTHDGNRKAQVMKDCLRRHNNKLRKILGSIIPSKQKMKKGVFEPKDCVWVHMRK
jgi:hypothetical protein